MNNSLFPDRSTRCGIGHTASRMAFTAAALAAAAALMSCQSTDKPSFPVNPTDSGSRYSDFGLPGSDMGMQNTDLED